MVLPTTHQGVPVFASFSYKATGLREVKQLGLIPALGSGKARNRTQIPAVWTTLWPPRLKLAFLAEQRH